LQTCLHAKCAPFVPDGPLCTLEGVTPNGPPSRTRHRSDASRSRRHTPSTLATFASGGRARTRRSACFKGSCGNSAACGWNDCYVRYPAGRTRTLPGLLPLPPDPTVIAKVTFEQIPDRMGQTRPDGNRGARQRQVRHRQDQHQGPDAAAPKEKPGIVSATAARTAHSTSNPRGTGLCGRTTLSVIKAATPSHDTSHPNTAAIMSLPKLRPCSRPHQTMPDDLI
jgi:hypothetical protein